VILFLSFSFLQYFFQFQKIEKTRSFTVFPVFHLKKILLLQ